MTIRKSAYVIAAVAALAISPAAAVAQDTLATDTETTTEREDDKDFPWGLLGLLGLAGLLGRKKNDDDRVRRDTTTGTGTGTGTGPR